MSPVFNERLRALFAPPRYMALPLAGVDLSTSGVKAVRLEEGTHGLVLAQYVEARLPAGAFTDGEIVDRAAVIEALASAAEATGIAAANVSLPESKSYLFETTVPGVGKDEQRLAIEQHLDEFIPLPPAETIFDFIEIGRNENGEAEVAGIGFARRIIEETISTFDAADISTRSLEGETFASSRALLPYGDESTTLIIDVGKTTTKVSIVTRRIPRFATTINIGGHALTLAVQKYFGVTEAEARKVKAERGIVPTPGNEEYLAAMLSTVSAIRDEISRHLAFWQERAVPGSTHEPVSRALLVGGNASVRGLPEYLEGTLQIPVVAGDVFTNLASRDTWVPSLDYTESLAYATAIGLALRDYATPYA
ncbi:MAG TPA: pilus assembly protein PilM [Candidatus Paceibacterota bacterium]|nr:pilus assembly protein PilM [Candidatus Paceibacterota bacterium]